MTISYFFRKVLKKIPIGDVEPDDTISAVSEARLLAKVVPVPELCKSPSFKINSLIFFLLKHYRANIYLFKVTIEILEKGVKYFTPFSSVSSVDFE